LSIIIPVYNEEKTIHLILDKVKAVNLIKAINKEVVMVNDASTDQSEERIKTYIAENTDLNIQYFNQPKKFR
jgi:glycosyltransferase involved in cell wall biosynthesis